MRFVVVPDAPRKQLQRFIEVIANTAAVFEESARTLSSPMPHVSFRPHDQAARSSLEATRGIHGPKPVAASQKTTSAIPLDCATASAVADRGDGVALLAEAYSQQHALGCYREIIRFFERAFRLPASQLEARLAALLDPRDAYSETQRASA